MIIEQAEYKYIYFKEATTSTGKGIWACRNKHDHYVLGIVKWYPTWKQYCFYPEGTTIFSKGCLEDVADFLDKINTAAGVRSR